MTTITIATDYSPFPAGRYPDDGPFNGERFRDTILLPLLNKAEKVVVDIDNVATLPSSFWEEIWGGMIRKHRIDKATARRRFAIRTTDRELESYVDIAWQFLDEAKPE